jgi:serine/threonine-protein kinase
VPERFLGQTLGGRYRLTRLLGTGAYAWVYEAVDTELEIPVAVKVLRPEHTGNEVSEARFRREATTAARLRHPNIITVRDVGRTDDVTWVAMDLVPLNLARRLQVMPYLPETDVVRVGLEVAAALAVAHADNVIHRDIKPDNILIGTTGEAIVCDFGLARALTSGADLSATNQVLGTPHYFSPEQAKGDPLDGRSDLYALGVTLYRAATGKLPFEGDDWYVVARQHVDVAPLPPRKHVPAISGAFEGILLKLMAKKPEDRFPSATALSDALSRLPSAPSTGSRLAITPGGTTTAHTIASATGGRRRAMIGVAAALLICFVSLWALRDQPAVSTAWARLTGAEPARDSLADTLAVAVVSPATDSQPADSNAMQDTAAVPSDTPTPVVRPTVRLTQLSISSNSDSTAVSVNGGATEFAPWTGDKLKPGRYIIAASLVGGPGVTGCPYSEHVDTLTLTAGDRRRHSVELARCSRVTLDVKPSDAVVAFLDWNGRTVTQGTAARISPAMVRAGEWRIRASAPRCVEFNGVDTLRAGSDTVRFVLVCS